MADLENRQIGFQSLMDNIDATSPRAKYSYVLNPMAEGYFPNGVMMLVENNGWVYDHIFSNGAER
ncbi:MAG: hypothetical protein ACXV7J_02040 [Methylomonas sp.]